jgi:hypothetical protein
MREGYMRAVSVDASEAAERSGNVVAPMPVPTESFHNYIEGGRFWPQKRCAANVYLLNSILAGVSYPSFVAKAMNTLNSELSNEQLQKLRSLTNQLHVQAGIPLNVTVEKLQKEWAEARSYAARTLVSYCTNCEFQIYQPDPEKYISDLFRQFVSDALTHLSSDEFARLQISAACAHEVIRKEKTLSGLYRLTFFSRSIVNDTGRPQFANRKCDLDDLLARKELHRRTILLSVGLAIQRKLQDTYPARGTSWLTTGFFSE